MSERVAMHDLRPYQVESIAAVEQEWERGQRATLLVLATGLGKTTVFAEIVRRNQARTGKRARALVLAHRIELVSQAASRIRSLGLEVEIESGDQRASPLGSLYGSACVVATVQTLRGRRLERWPRDAVNLIVIDEAHHATAAQYVAILDRFPDARVLGVTATPDRGDGTALCGVFGSTAYTMSILDGVRGGYLCDVRSRLVDLDCVSLDKVRVTAQGHGRDLAPEDIAKAMEGTEALHAIAAPVAKETGDRKTLIFMPNVATAHLLAEVLAGYVGASKVASLDGGSDPELRADVLRRYVTGEVQYLVNCALFTEGFDAPETSCVVIARPTKSRALYAQMVGRGTRLHPAKADLLVLDMYPANTRHDLAHIADIFDGDDAGTEEGKLAAEAMRDGASAMQAREKAKVRSLELAAQREEAQRRAKIRAEAKYVARDRDPWGGQWTMDRVLGVDPSMYAATIPKASETQLQKMAALRLEVDARETIQSASRKIQAAVNRNRNGQCTVKMARVLARAGLRDDLAFDDARGVMDYLANNGWRPSPEIVARYGRAA